MAEIYAPFVRKGVALGENIFVFNNLRTNQVIYSLTRTPDDKKSLPQLTFVGKKSVPSTIRKDSWLPLARIYFPRPVSGLRAFKLLREFRKRHEYEWDRSILKDKRWPDIEPRKRRARILMDQKANSIADIAATLRIFSKEAMRDEALSPSQKVSRSGTNRPGAKTEWPKSSMKGVTVAWTNIEDASYAEAWPPDVPHYILEKDGKPGIPPALSSISKPRFADKAILSLDGPEQESGDREQVTMP
ncbi:MAG: hypothetical protein M1814_005551 [Vezdaea aestivalis]|nr:MAG: hypothetical protein M1814_005551 [Vezdaea aestivalis]